MKFTRAGKEPVHVWFLLRRGARFAAELWSPRHFATGRHESADAARDADESDWSARHRARRSPSVERGRDLIVCMPPSKIKISPPSDNDTYVAWLVAQKYVSAVRDLFRLIRRRSQ